MWGVKDNLRVVKERAALSLCTGMTPSAEEEREALVISQFCQHLGDWIEERATQQLNHSPSQFSPVQLKLALCIGISKYSGVQTGDASPRELPGCVEDAVFAALTFQKLGFHVLSVLNESATTATVMHLLNAVRACAEGRKLAAFALHFSGYGAYRVVDGRYQATLLTHDCDEVPATPMSCRMLCGHGSSGVFGQQPCCCDVVFASVGPGLRKSCPADCSAPSPAHPPYSESTMTPI